MRPGLGQVYVIQQSTLRSTLADSSRHQKTQNHSHNPVPLHFIPLKNSTSLPATPLGNPQQTATKLRVIFDNRLNLGTAVIL